MTNALAESARGVDTAWCKGDLRAEAESKEAGDTYCAVGHMAKALGEVRGLTISLDGEWVGPADEIAVIDKWTLWNRANPEDMDGGPQFVKGPNVEGTYAFVNDTPEAKVLAEVILSNFHDRLGDWGWLIDEDHKDYDEFIYTFNDHKDTTREEVVAMMEKAAIVLEDRAVAEDKDTDDLVNEIDELLSEKV